MDLTDDNRSWAEICEEDLLEEATQKCMQTNNDTLEEGEIRDNSFTLPQAKHVKESQSASLPSSTPLKSKFSFSTSCNEGTKTVDKSAGETLSYAKVLSQGITSKEPLKGTGNLTGEDLSLTSHLDVFHVDSPQKNVDNEEPVLEIFVDEDTVMFSPCKSTTCEPIPPSKNTKRPFMLIDSPARESRDRALKANKIAKSKMGSDVHTNTKESTVGSDVNSPSSKRELEMDPEVLVRRQKQIDYGKNTLGYETYTKLVPKYERTKEHPKTPPKHLKMSRRAWDGLIRNWRMKLHKWDPVSETDTRNLENANSDQFSVSSEDPSSYDSSSVRSDSTVSTPKKCRSVAEGEDGCDTWSIDRESFNKSENSKELWSRRPLKDEKSENSTELWTKRARKNEKSDEDDYLGCEPLTENCVKACS